MQKQKKILVVAPHPDDETLGVGGTLLAHKARGDELYWLIMTHVQGLAGYSAEFQTKRAQEIKEVASKYGFKKTEVLSFATTQLDRYPQSEIITAVGNFISAVAPQIMYLPCRTDAHSDHTITFDAVAACTKWFRYPSVERVLSYETLSETEFGLRADAFRPNVFIDITGFLEEKLGILKLFSSELGEFPFPRSEEAVRALALLRGSASGYKAAESFQLLKERLSYG